MRGLDLSSEIVEETGCSRVWFLRRMLRVLWMASLTKKRVMEMAEVRRELLGSDKKDTIEALVAATKA